MHTEVFAWVYTLQIPHLQTEIETDETSKIYNYLKHHHFCPKGKS